MEQAKKHDDDIRDYQAYLKTPMTVAGLQAELAKYRPGTRISIAGDEEWNVIYGRVEIDADPETGRLVLSGPSGSEVHIGGASV